MLKKYIIILSLIICNTYTMNQNKMIAVPIREQQAQYVFQQSRFKALPMDVVQLLMIFIAHSNINQNQYRAKLPYIARENLRIFLEAYPTQEIKKRGPLVLEQLQANFEVEPQKEFKNSRFRSLTSAPTRKGERNLLFLLSYFLAQGVDSDIRFFGKNSTSTLNPLVVTRRVLPFFAAYPTRELTGLAREIREKFPNPERLSERAVEIIVQDESLAKDEALTKIDELILTGTIATDILLHALGRYFSERWVNDATGDNAEGLSSCVKFFNCDIFKLLIAAGANINVEFEYETVRATALMVASALGNADLVKLLIAEQADLNFVGSEGLTALIIAAYSGHEKIVRMLIEAGAVVREIDKDKAIDALSRDDSNSCWQIIIDEMSSSSHTTTQPAQTQHATVVHRQEREFIQALPEEKERVRAEILRLQEERRERTVQAKEDWNACEELAKTWLISPFTCETSLAAEMRENREKDLVAIKAAQWASSLDSMRLAGRACSQAFQAEILLIIAGSGALGTVLSGDCSDQALLREANRLAVNFFERKLAEQQVIIDSIDSTSEQRAAAASEKQHIAHLYALWQGCIPLSNSLDC